MCGPSGHQSLGSHVEHRLFPRAAGRSGVALGQVEHRLVQSSVSMSSLQVLHLIPAFKYENDV
jgi:hypothetical protein